MPNVNKNWSEGIAGGWLKGNRGETEKQVREIVEQTSNRGHVNCGYWLL
jgi:hypothetical protein